MGEEGVGEKKNEVNVRRTSPSPPGVKPSNGEKSPVSKSGKTAQNLREKETKKTKPTTQDLFLIVIALN
jgi:hypothetical protein